MQFRPKFKNESFRPVLVSELVERRETIEIWKMVSMRSVGEVISGELFKL